MEPFPASPEPEYTAQTKGPAPASVTTAVKLIWVSVALGLISTIVTFAFLDDLIDTAMDSGGGLDRDAARAGVIVGALVGVVLSVAIAALFAYFIGKGANWARIVYTIFIALGIVVNLFGLGGSQPIILLLLTLVSLVLSVAILYFLFRPESNRYFSGQRPAV